jgi:hypothetical protein
VRKNAEDWADAVDFDRQLREGRVGDLLAPSLGFLHKSRIPLDEVDLRTVEERGQGNLFEMECEGMCGL